MSSWGMENNIFESTVCTFVSQNLITKLLLFCKWICSLSRKLKTLYAMQHWGESGQSFSHYENYWFALKNVTREHQKKLCEAPERISILKIGIRKVRACNLFLYSKLTQVFRVNRRLPYQTLTLYVKLKDSLYMMRFWNENNVPFYFNLV